MSSSARPSFAILSVAFLLLVLLPACQSSKRVVILVDGERRIVETNAPTVGVVLREQAVTLGDNDRVEPPDYTPIARTATIQIVRVEIRTETAREPIEFERQFTRDENLPEGQVRVLRLGSNGQAEITYQLTLEDGREVSRRELARHVLQEPVNEIQTIGTQGTVAPVDLQGTLLYIASGNAWVVRHSTVERRPLTTTGDLDGRVFEATSDGKYLLYSRRAATNAAPSALNTLWLIDTVPLNDTARRVPIDNVLAAQWAPGGSAVVALTTGERTPGAPGWKAFNDLIIAVVKGITETQQVIDTDIQTQTVTIAPTPPGVATRPITRTVYVTNRRITTITQTAKTPLALTTRMAIPRSAPAPYSWWGWNFAWSPDAKTLAYALADQVGLVGLETGERRPLARFAYYNTHGDWVWLPQLAWSPDSRFLAATVHTPPDGAGLPEDATGFDLSLLARDRTFSQSISRNTGMWSFPTWSGRDARGESKIAFGIAQNLANSERSLYSLYIMDRDGSNREQIYPELENELSGLRVVQVAWSPDASQLIALRDGDLWLYDIGTRQWIRLTANGDSKLPKWK